MKILVTGCFDIIHVGHVKLFKFIKEAFPNNSVIVAVDSDSRVTESKGEGRPINNFIDRVKLLRMLDLGDLRLEIKTDKELIDLCKKETPIRILGSDYRNKPIIGEEYCKAIVFFNRIEEYSTTNIIEKINENNSTNCGYML